MVISVKPKIYTAGPLGFSEAGRAFHNDIIVPMLEKIGFEVLDPWKLTPDEMVSKVARLPYGVKRRGSWSRLNRIIGLNNAIAIRDSQAVFAVLDGTDVDSGTAAEIGFAAALNKRIIGYRGDFRLSADNDGSRVNLQVEYFIVEPGQGDIFTTVEESRAALTKLYEELSVEMRLSR